MEVVVLEVIANSLKRRKTTITASLSACFVTLVFPETTLKKITRMIP